MAVSEQLSKLRGAPKIELFRRPAMLATARRPALVPADVDDRHRHHRDDHGEDDYDGDGAEHC